MTKTKLNKSALNSSAKSTKADAPKAPGRSTKTDAVIKLLGARRGASIEEIGKATGWQAHSVRGFLSGTVKKKMGLTLDSGEDKNGLCRYRIVTSAAEAGTVAEAGVGAAVPSEQA